LLNQIGQKNLLKFPFRQFFLGQTVELSRKLRMLSGMC